MKADGVVYVPLPPHVHVLPRRPVAGAGDVCEDAVVADQPPTLALRLEPAFDPREQWVGELVGNVSVGV